MPNFEKLIRQQQSNSNERLRVIESKSEFSNNKPNSQPNFAGTQAFFGAIFGSVIGTITVLAAIELDFFKIESIINFIN